MYAAKYVLHRGPPKLCSREQHNLLIALFYEAVHEDEVATDAQLAAPRVGEASFRSA